MDSITPRFTRVGKDDVYRKLQKEVKENVLSDKSIQQRSKTKALGLLLLYVVLYFSILYFGYNTLLLFLLYQLMGFTMIILFVNSFHDAAHGAVFNTPKQNRMFTYVLELFGSNSHVWIQRHVLLHHPYPNIPNWDCDIKQSDVVRIFPTSPLLDFHKYQHIYMWFLYPFYTLIWLFYRDFKDFFGTKDNYLKRVHTIPKIEYIKLFISKSFYLFYSLIIPIAILPLEAVYVVLAWFLMHLTSSILGVVALISTHVDEEAVFPIPNAQGDMNTSWLVHQMTVTKDFSAGHPVADFLYGGFTHHVAHHLFPNVAHNYYPYITPIIRKYAAEYNLPYKCYPAAKAVQSHFVLLRNKGNGFDVFLQGDL